MSPIHEKEDAPETLAAFDPREAAAPGAPKLLLLHGFPSAGHMFRELIPLRADRFHLIAPDLPGFGQSDTPAGRSTFDRIAETIDGFTEVVGFDRHAVYVFDYGAPTVRTHEPPLLAVWGKNDPFFLPRGAEAFKRDIPGAVVRFFDTGHFALETHAVEIAAAIRDTINAAIVALAKAFSDRGIADGVQVNSVLPGPVMTGRRRSYLQHWAPLHGMTVEDATAKFPKEVGIARYGEPEEIAELMAFLVSPGARWMTGSALRMDGGEVKSI